MTDGERRKARPELFEEERPTLAPPRIGTSSGRWRAVASAALQRGFGRLSEGDFDKGNDDAALALVPQQTAPEPPPADAATAEGNDAAPAEAPEDAKRAAPEGGDSNAPSSAVRIVVLPAVPGGAEPLARGVGRGPVGPTGTMRMLLRANTGPTGTVRILRKDSTPDAAPATDVRVEPLPPLVAETRDVPVLAETRDVPVLAETRDVPAGTEPGRARRNHISIPALVAACLLVATLVYRVEGSSASESNAAPPPSATSAADPTSAEVPLPAATGSPTTVVGSAAPPEVSPPPLPSTSSPPTRLSGQGDPHAKKRRNPRSTVF